MRRTWLRGHANILKRYLVHVAAFNLGLVMRQMLGVGTPRRFAALSGLALRARDFARSLVESIIRVLAAFRAIAANLVAHSNVWIREPGRCLRPSFSTRC